MRWYHLVVICGGCLTYIAIAFLVLWQIGNRVMPHDTPHGLIGYMVDGSLCITALGFYASALYLGIGCPLVLIHGVVETARSPK